MRLGRWTRTIAAVVLLTSSMAVPALADDMRGIVRQIIVMWFPMLVILALWIVFVRKMRTGKQAQMIERQIALIDRYIPHLDALEQKLDRIIELLDRRSDR